MMKSKEFHHFFTILICKIKANIMNNTVKRLITKTLEESFRLSRGIRKDV